MKIKLLLWPVLVGHAFLAFAQPNPDTLWTGTYGGVRLDAALSILQTTDGGYVTTGKTESFGFGVQDTTDVYLIKTDSLGDTLWTRTFGGIDYDGAFAVQQHPDGGYIVIGHTKSFGSGNRDIYCIRTNSSGDTLWTRTYGGNGEEIGLAVQRTSDGGYVMAGSSSSFGAGGDDIYLIKTDSNGDTIWTRTYGGTGQDQPYVILPTYDGGYVIGGTTSSFGAGSSDFYLIVLDSFGDTLWTRTFGGAYQEWCGGICQTSDHGYVLFGETRSYGQSPPTYSDFYIVKTDSIGDTLWTNTYGGPFHERCFGSHQTSDGGFMISGYTRSFGAGDWDIYIVRTTSNGHLLWTRTYGGNDADFCFSSNLTDDGGYIIAGSTYSYGAGNSDVYLIKTGPDTTSTSVRPDRTRLPSPQFNLYTPYPNPFNSVVVIPFTAPVASEVRLAIYNILGQRVQEFDYPLLSPGTYHARWDASSFASGMYIARLSTAHLEFNRKVVLLK